MINNLSKIEGVDKFEIQFCPDSDVDDIFIPIGKMKIIELLFNKKCTIIIKLSTLHNDYKISNFFLL